MKKMSLSLLHKSFFCIFSCLILCGSVCGESSKEQDKQEEKREEPSKILTIKKTGVVFLNGIIEVLPAYRIWKKDIEAWREKVSSGLIKEKTSLEKEWKKLDGLRGLIGEEKYNEKRKALEDRVTKLEQSHSEMQKKIYVSEQSVAKFLDQEMQKILDDLCSKRGISLVLNGAVVLHIDRSELNLSIVDLTSDVARLMEKRIDTLKDYVPGAKG
ncbi:outer membrane protein [Holospora undulata HU1]|uniref:Outer membrane protein n=3 Tax=Holospora TaxID=44747 RepID=A0A061JGH1_9PROT|nr:OmpH family outer membrane protein [Holospora elegans]ETZ05120.1 outer membrane protein [Holospora undulata HU1]GAJ45808.1 outer membrane protein [Holospora elegans E1]